MDFQKYQCPVCQEQFKDGDDIVVCPECGAPHHRECYEKENRCFYDDRHGDDFSFEELYPEDEEQIFHDSPADEEEAEAAQEQQEQSAGGAQQGFPFGNMPFNILDPLAGMKPEEEVAEGIKASEMAKFVGKNTPYFLIVFKRLFDTHHSRINFSAFLFSGIYFLYRKMTKLGIAVTLLNIALMVGAAALMLTPMYTQSAEAVVAFFNNPTAYYTADTQQSIDLMSKMLFYSLPNTLYNLQFVIMILSGIFANRLYYKHCCKRVRQIKADTPEDKTGDALEKAGGVNFAFALSLGIAYVVIYFLCNYFYLIT